MSAALNLKSGIKIKVQVKSGPHSGLSLESEKHEWLIGRGTDCDLILSDDARVSRQHAQIRISGDEVWITNMSQKNFVLVNGAKVENSKLNAKDKVQIGESEIEFDIQGLEPVQKPQPKSPVQLQPTSVAPNISSMPSSAVFPLQTKPNYQQTAAYPIQNQPSFPTANTYSQTTADEKAKKFRFYLVLVVLVAAVIFIFTKDARKGGSARAPFRGSAQMELDREQSEKLKENLRERKEKMDTLQNRRAQENYIKGFRDFRHGQFARAYDSFQVVLNLDPDNQLAKQYLELSRIRFDEQMKFAFIQGQRYREKKNYRMCANSFAQVMTMLQGQRDNATYKEAKQYFEECSLAQEGRF